MLHVLRFSMLRLWIYLLLRPLVSFFLTHLISFHVFHNFIHCIRQTFVGRLQRSADFLLTSLAFSFLLNFYFIWPYFSFWATFFFTDAILSYGSTHCTQHTVYLSGIMVHMTNLAFRQWQWYQNADTTSCQTPPNYSIFQNTMRVLLTNMWQVHNVLYMLDLHRFENLWHKISQNGNSITKEKTWMVLDGILRIWRSYFT